MAGVRSTPGVPERCGPREWAPQNSSGVHSRGPHHSGASLRDAHRTALAHRLGVAPWLRGSVV